MNCPKCVWKCFLINYWSYLKRALFEGQTPLVSDTSNPFSLSLLLDLPLIVSLTVALHPAFAAIGAVPTETRCARWQKLKGNVVISNLIYRREEKKEKKRESQRCACVCSNPADQSSDGGLTPPTNHVRVPLQVITCTFKETRRGRNISRSLLFSFQSCPWH